MKKLLLTVIATLAFSGAILAQHTTFWPEFNSNHYQFPAAFVAFIQVDGTFIEGSDSYADLEVAAFTGDQCRGHQFMDYYAEEGDPHPIVELSLFYNTGESVPVTFRLYDNNTGIEYTTCVSNVEILTGTNHTELYFNYDNAVILNFTTPPSHDKTITGYGTSTGGYHLISSPVRKMDPVFVANMLSNEYDLYWFNQSGDSDGNQWMNYKAEPFFLERGKGYLYANNQTVTLTFTGTPYSGDGIVPLDYDAAAPFDMAGMNLVGNPFAENAYITERPFYVLNTEGSEIVPSEVSSVGPMEGVFVVAAGEGETVAFSTTSSSTKNNLVSINLTSGNRLIDRAIVSFDEGRQLPKYQINKDNTKVYIEQGNKEFAVVSSGGQGELPISFKAKESGTYTFTFNSQDVNFDFLHLIDNKTGDDINLLETPSYTFEASHSDYPSRFRMVFNAMGINEYSHEFAFVTNGHILLSGVNGNTTVQVIDALGRIILSENGLTSISTDGMANGVYVLRIINSANTTTQKIVVK